MRTFSASASLLDLREQRLDLAIDAADLFLVLLERLLGGGAQLGRLVEVLGDLVVAIGHELLERLPRQARHDREEDAEVHQRKAERRRPTMVLRVLGLRGRSPSSTS